ncbi:MAG TPA: hypothetical protein VFV58_05300 [Blastocatellia bacterium]|jgi:hypothetical protein|nr:hypothetical protein [Blastocatellia bacterium]
MSQENPTPENTKENRKKLLLGGLFIVLAGVVYYQYFSGSSAQTPPARVPSAITKTTPSPTPQRQTSGTPAPIISQPLDLASIQGGSHSSGGTGRNIFVYPTPTPTPAPPPVTPTPTPTPWPVPVSSVNPGGVIARTAGFTLTVFGEKIPQDAQGFINGRAYPTTFVSATQVKINVPAEAIRSPGVLGVSVRSSSDANLLSNTISLNVAAPPEPPYKYIGLITLKNIPTAVLAPQGGDDEVYNVKRGGIVGGKWKVINITPKNVEIEDTSIKVSHIINFTIDAK